jgi:murein DD-endopeptidase MepM/ murein hydrolase activator NlpD
MGPFHYGTDIANSVGTPIKSVTWGKVKSIGYDTMSGNKVYINHFFIFQTRYLHLSSITAYSGQKVNFNTEIGKMGSTGRSTGPHLHYEFRVLGQPIPPYLILIPNRIINYFNGYEIIDEIIRQIKQLF